MSSQEIGVSSIYVWLKTAYGFEAAFCRLFVEFSVWHTAYLSAEAVSYA